MGKINGASNGARSTAKQSPQSAGRDAMNSLRNSIRHVMPVQVAWAILSAIWNIAGVVLIAQGLRAPGPTASITVAIVLLALAVAFAVTVRRWSVVYLLVSIVGGLAAIAAVVKGFTADPALWPSEFWRYAGVVLNGVGSVASVLAIAAVVRLKCTEMSRQKIK